MRALASSILLAPLSALAHEGHGAPEIHLHPSELLGLLALAAVLAFAIARYWKK